MNQSLYEVKSKFFFSLHQVLDYYSCPFSKHALRYFKKRLTSGVVENPEISTDPNFTASAAPPPPPWSITVPPGPHSGPSHYPASNPFGSPWMHPTGLSHPMGPIPMGYQLAKDPLTGQMLLIPTGKNLQTLGGSPWSSG